MNEEEVKEALHISEVNITPSMTNFIFNKQLVLYNRTAEVTFYFSEYHTLFLIQAKFKPEDIAYVQQAITKKRGQGEYSYNEKSDPVTDTVNWNDDLLETNTKWLTEVEELYHKFGVKTPDSPMEDGVMISDRPITSWRLTLDKNSPFYGTLSFNGQFAAMLYEPDRYEPTTKNT
ncbi:hypothetical protein [Paenibacillus sp. YAF4_2]|uniref:hypothetical protein n=1 Tax=Paenibacillus sp. YAF4_2 TaxID=3233085 RepID=UPI003F991CA2